MDIEKCKKCEYNTEGMMSDTIIWYCEKVGEYCSDMKRCPKNLKKYKTHVHVVMEADVYVYAENEDEARDIVDNGVYPTDYANETCGFEYDCDEVDEMDNVTCDCNFMEIDEMEVCKTKFYNKELRETYGTADLEDVIMMLYDETEG